jgi:Terminase large subunit, T4likevirus-type, N-terminal
MRSGLAHYERQAAAIAREVRLLQDQATPPPRRSAVDLATDLLLALDPWQRAVVTTEARDILLLCARQTGKSTVASLMALHQAVSTPGSLVLVVSPSERQSKRVLRTVRRYYAALRAVASPVTEGQLTLELRNGSEIHALPGSESTLRGFAAVDLLVLDEAARVDDAIYSSVRPMLAVSQGTLLALSTPFGKRGWFHREWSEGGPSWHRAKVTAWDCPRISPAWLAAERERIGVWWFQQEFECAFKDAVDAFFRSEDIDVAVSSEVRPLFSEVA